MAAHYACQLAGRLFGVTVERADGRAPVWHPDVQFFALAKDGRPKAYFYLDPYSRPAGASPTSPPAEAMHLHGDNDITARLYCGHRWLHVPTRRRWQWGRAELRVV